MNVVVAPVSRSIFSEWLLTDVVIKIKDIVDGFKLGVPRAAPSFDVPGLKNGDSQALGVLLVDIESSFQMTGCM